MIRVATYEDVLDLEVNLLQAQEEPDSVNYVLSHIGRHAYSLVADSGNVICVFGYTSVWTGVIEVWSLFAQGAELNVFKMRELRRLLDGVPDIHRAQMVTLADAEKPQNLAKFLGFTQEGILKKGSPLGKDMVMWGRTY